MIYAPLLDQPWLAGWRHCPETIERQSLHAALRTCDLTCVAREARLPAAAASAAGTMPGLGACAVRDSAALATRCSSCPRVWLICV